MPSRWLNPMWNFQFCQQISLPDSSKLTPSGCVISRAFKSLRIDQSCPLCSDE